MHTFKVVKEPHGWAVRLGCAMSTPFWSRELAVREANNLCNALRGHGVGAEVVVEVEAQTVAPQLGRNSHSALNVRLSGHRPRRRAPLA